jgi:hypothetical protein
MKNPFVLTKKICLLHLRVNEKPGGVNFTYLCDATKSSSFFAPLRLSAPSLTKKDLQCNRSSAGTP